MKAAVYVATRNYYADTLPGMKSLLKHTHIDKVYFLIEDDVFPYWLPDCVETINVRDQQYFPPTGPNYVQPWTWICLMRAAYTKVLPELDKVLSLDADTFINDDISELWEIPLDDYYLAGVTEPNKKGFPQPYINFGVAMLNLKRLREDGIDDKIIYSLNKEYTFANEQDVYNKLCLGRIRVISSTYNANDYTAPCENPKITHFAGIGEAFPWSRVRWQDFPIVQEYKALPWVIK